MIGLGYQCQLTGQAKPSSVVWFTGQIAGQLGKHWQAFEGCRNAALQTQDTCVYYLH